MLLLMTAFLLNYRHYHFYFIINLHGLYRFEFLYNCRVFCGINAFLVVPEKLHAHPVPYNKVDEDN
jgi:hypothetical protein